MTHLVVDADDLAHVAQLAALGRVPLRAQRLVQRLQHVGQLDVDEGRGVLDVEVLEEVEREGQRFAAIAKLTGAQRWVIAIETKIQSTNTLTIILNCVIGIIN